MVGEGDKKRKETERRGRHPMIKQMWQMQMWQMLIIGESSERVCEFFVWFLHFFCLFLKVKNVKQEWMQDKWWIKWPLLGDWINKEKKDVLFLLFKTHSKVLCSTVYRQQSIQNSTSLKGARIETISSPSILFITHFWF